MQRSFNGFINNFVGFLRLFVYANFWVAGAVYALTRVTEILIDAHHHSLAVLNAAGTLVVYGFARYFEGPSGSKKTSKITAWRQQMPNLTKLSILGGATLLYHRISSNRINKPFLPLRHRSRRRHVIPITLDYEE